MKKITLFIILIINQIGLSQKLEIGPMFNYESTTFNIPDSSFIIIGEFGGEGSRTTGFESNFSFGVYSQVFLKERIAIAGELFYTKTTSSELTNVEFSSINFIPYISLALIVNTELYLNIGGGIAYMIKTPDFENDDLNNRTKKTDIPLKLGLSYRFPKYFIIDAGVHSSVTKVVKDELLRTAYFLGIKIPLNQFLNK